MRALESVIERSWETIESQFEETQDTRVVLRGIETKYQCCCYRRTLGRTKEKIVYFEEGTWGSPWKTNCLLFFRQSALENPQLLAPLPVLQMQIADRIIKAVRANETLIELPNYQQDRDRIINKTLIELSNYQRDAASVNYFLPSAINQKVRLSSV